MTTATAPAAIPVAPLAPGSGLRVTQVRVLRSEWVKFRSLRSTLWTMGLSVVLMIGLGAMFSAIS
nr:ABC transporter permease [Dermatophilaceae bacterium]